MGARPNIALVHGAWADGSSWSAVIERLQADGYRVTAPQFPMTGLACWRIRPRVGRDILPGQTSVGEEIA
jgi:pimeloyl-ACP methyl ester carboxylesterase